MIKDFKLGIGLSLLLFNSSHFLFVVSIEEILKFFIFYQTVPVLVYFFEDSLKFLAL